MGARVRAVAEGCTATAFSLMARGRWHRAPSAGRRRRPTSGRMRTASAAGTVCYNCTAHHLFIRTNIRKKRTWAASRNESRPTNQRRWRSRQPGAPARSCRVPIQNRGIFARIKLILGQFGHVYARRFGQPGRFAGVATTPRLDYLRRNRGQGGAFNSGPAFSPGIGEKGATFGSGCFEVVSDILAL